MAGEIIRMGDTTSHNGTVIEGSQTDICMGKPIAYVGHKVHCPKCRGDFPIVEGVMTTTFYGKGVAVAGMKTSCGATLIAGQFTDTVEWSSGGSGGASSKAAAQAAAGASSKAAVQAAAAGATASVMANYPADSPDEQIRVVDDKTGEPVPDLAYYIEAPDGSIYTGHTDADGLCVRVVTYQPEELSIWLGEDAEKKKQAS